MRALRFPIDPRMLPPAKVARRLGLTPAEFATKRGELETAGFPCPDAVLGNYSLEAVDKWIDRRSGLTPANDAVSDPSVAAERIRTRAWAK